MRDLAEVLIPEVVLPTQLSAAHQNWPGWRRLCLAVLEDAIATLFRNLRIVGSPKAVSAIAEVELWLTSDNRTYPFSFLNICDACEINAGYLLRGISEARRKKLTVNRWTWKRTELGSSNIKVRSVRLGRSRG